MDNVILKDFSFDLRDVDVRSVRSSIECTSLLLHFVMYPFRRVEGYRRIRTDGAPGRHCSSWTRFICLSMTS